ncbi:MAG TPA: threonine ammonia-lyase [Verrucomicrobiae bacterium]|jgi:threonine dehydratase|nr:threonine ammonia-lyase [Verrucomicrobiae bacterium]
MPAPLSLKDIEAAAERISGAIVYTPCPVSFPLSEATGMRILCKMENLQRTGSFKERGACNALLLLEPEQRKRGIIAASAGNHALGLSYHGQLLGIPVTVVMPRFAPLTKISNCQRFGAKVVLEGSSLSEGRVHADQLAAKEGLTYINGYDDLPIIAGQGTMGLEIAAQVPDLDAIIIPVGGAGLLAGVSLALKSIKPNVVIIGVEPFRAASYSAALRAGRPVPVEMKPTLADGLAVAQVGATAFQISKPFLDRMLLVDERAVAVAILRLLELEKSLVEGAGAAGVAACLQGLAPELRGKKVVLPLCGGNIDISTLGRVLERGLTHDGRLSRVTAAISDRPGGLARFAAVLAEEGASILEINHDRAFASDDITIVTVHCIIETRDESHITAIRQRLEAEGFVPPEKIERSRLG